jgi:hypothetical protein
MNTNNNINTKKLGGLTTPATSKKHTLQHNPPKKHTRKHRGYIRGIKKANGNVYYYYCYTPRNAHGDYPELKEYLGTAERILQAVKQATAPGPGN